MRRSHTTLGAAAVSTAALLLAGCTGSTSNGATTVTFRTWDTNAAAAYRTSFTEFHKHNPSIKVRVDVVPWTNYFTKLRTDIAGGSADDIFWINAQSYGGYAKNGALVNIDETYGSNAASTKKTWAPAVVDQFTQGGTLWGVPQTSDGGIALYYNKKLLSAAGLSASDIDHLTWSTGGGPNTLLKVAQKLTKDSSGKAANESGFDPKKVTQYGYSAAQDLQAIDLPFIGSNGGRYQKPDGTFTLTSPKTVQAFQYVVDLINKYHVAPGAADTNSNGNYALDAFTRGKEALFQSGLYNLPNVANAAKFDWGVVEMPAGTSGAVSVTNGVAAVGNAHSPHKAAIEKVLKWLGTEKGDSYIGSTGTNLPGVSAAQRAYIEYWKKRGVDISPFLDVIKKNATIPAPVGANYDGASAAAAPFLSSVFLGQMTVPEGLKKANDAANNALHE